MGRILIIPLEGKRSKTLTGESGGIFEAGHAGKASAREGGPEVWGKLTPSPCGQAPAPLPCGLSLPVLCHNCVQGPAPLPFLLREAWVGLPQLPGHLFPAFCPLQHTQNVATIAVANGGEGSQRHPALPAPGGLRMCLTAASLSVTGPPHPRLRALACARPPAQIQIPTSSVTTTSSQRARAPTFPAALLGVWGGGKPWLCSLFVCN